MFKWLLLSLLFPIQITSQETKLEYYQQLTISDGLAHNGITSILEDSRGYIWFGTYDGLNRYNGYDFKIYKNLVHKKIITSNRIREIMEDSQGDIWIGTDNGISVFDYSSEKFKNIYSFNSENKIVTGPIVRKILENKHRNEIICTTEGNGVLIFDRNYKLLRHLSLDTEFENKIDYFDGLLLDDSRCLLATSIGLLVLNTDTNKFNRVLEEEIAYSNTICKSDDDTLLISLKYGLGIVDFNVTNEGFKFKFIARKLADEGINSITIDKYRNVWFGTSNDGIIHLDNVDKLITNNTVKKSFFREKSGLIRTSSLTVTNNNECLVGTYNKGVYRFKLQKNPFKSYNTSMNYQYGIGSNEVISLAELDKDRVYLSTNRGGFSLFNTRNGNFEKLPFKHTRDYLSDGGTVFVDSDKNTWMKVSVIKGLNRISKNNKLIDNLYSDLVPSLGKDKSPRCILKDKKGNLWIGDFSGVYKIKFDEFDQIKDVEVLNNNSYFKDTKIALIRCMYYDAALDKIWVGTDRQGLFCVNVNDDDSLEKCKVNQYVADAKDKFSISSNFVTSIVKLPNKEMWIGTEGGGICKVNHSDTAPSFVTFSEEQGLSNNVVKDILFDKENNLWVSTNIGLNKFNRKDLSFKKYSKNEGLPFEDFNTSAVALKNGNFLFSGMNSFCYFKADELIDDKKIPKFEFGALEIFNKTIYPNDTINNRVLLNKRLEETKEIELKYFEDVFSIELNSLHYSAPENHYIKYKLSPINDDWITVASDQRKISFNGLQPGKYELSAKVSNSLKNWSKPKMLKIRISPPFWKTNWAIFGYILLLCLSVCIGFVVVLKIQSLRHSLEIEQMEKDNVKDINEAKLRFFSNISHEIKTPLTLINVPISLLYERYKVDFDAKQNIELIKRQSKKISQLLEQVFDFQKSDADLLKLNYTEFSFDEFINKITIDFRFMAKNDGKTLEVVKSGTEIFVSADKDKLEKILNNLLNNALKFTKPKDTIKVEYRKIDNNLYVEVSDTGKGIHEEDLSHVFERFYQSKNKESIYSGGTGIGLAFSKRLVEMHHGRIHVESKLNLGTKLFIELPIVTESNINKAVIDVELIIDSERKKDTNNFVIEEAVADLEVNQEFRNSTIFYVEDHMEMRIFVSGILSKHFNVKTFRNGQECLDALDEEWPEVVISDLLMPELNGLELCKRIKSDIKTSHIPVILLTACTSSEERIQGLKDGADAYINKPFEAVHLITRTEGLLLNRKQLRERYRIGIPLTKQGNKENSNDNEFLEKLYVLMAENLDNQELDLDQFARALYINRTHFYQKVKSLTNHTPFELLKIYRLKKGAELLAEGGLSVKEVAIRTGFKSRPHFTKLFKEKYNITPGMYANEIKKTYS
ncbi:hybrid sensor histidine kinase/response regulator transcription factor [Flavicella sediminum]|uniref:hybrid sensor histidine kinase/response regulator transcription factor n=1 Tax=Flavicella sediminum TaxID=2585141 RepID=UPI00111EDE04|nr:hybrid sensor histidine kinase/response regulator transcription factor [Flavicella sediminum]